MSTMLSFKAFSNLAGKTGLKLALAPTIQRGLHLSLQANNPDNNTDSDQRDSNAVLQSEKTINSVTLLGRVGSNPLKRGSIEHPVVTFSLATNSNYTYANGDVSQKTEWHRICVFKPFLRDIALNYVTKGQRVLVEGRIIYGETKDTEGISRHTSSIVADDLICFKNN